MRQRLRRSRKARRIAKKRGEDPSYIPRTKKFHFKTSTPLALSTSHDAVTGYPTTQLDSAGIRTFTVRMNDMLNVWQDGFATPPDGFNHVKDGYTKFYTIGGKVSFNFDMINVAGYKLYMLLHNTVDPLSDLREGVEGPFGSGDEWLGYSAAAGAFVNDAAAATWRNQIQTILEEKVSKKLVSTHWLQRGDGYNSVGTISLKYKPHILDPDRGKIMDDDNEVYATLGTFGRQVERAPINVDFISIILIPTADPYNIAFMKNQTAMVWGKVNLSQIVVAINDEDAIATARAVAIYGQRQGLPGEAENPDLP